MAKAKTTTKKTASTKKTTAKKTTKKAASKSTASRKTRSKSPAAKKAKETEVKVDRRKLQKDRRDDDRRQASAPVDAEKRTQGERRTKVARRRQIDPTTCERDYDNAEIEFMHALDEYKRAAGRMFPTCSEILEVVRGLGYRRLTPEQLATLGIDEKPASEGEEGGEEDGIGANLDSELGISQEFLEEESLANFEG